MLEISGKEADGTTLSPSLRLPDLSNYPHKGYETLFSESLWRYTSGRFIDVTFAEIPSCLRCAIKMISLSL